MSINIPQTLAAAAAGINQYLGNALASGAITQGQFEEAGKKTVPNLRAWLNDPEIDRLSSNLKAGVADAVAAERWEDLVNAWRKDLSFGTGGIRGMMAFDRESIVKMKDEGLDARILKGPNTLNNVVVLRVSAGVAQFGRSGGRSFDRIVLGYDSRVRGGDFARIIAEEFLAFGYTVYLFDEPCPYPMVTYAIPYEKIKAQVGLLISASHNDYRYNGYKLSCGNGSQFDPKQRDEMYEQYIVKATFADVKLCPLADAPKGKLYWLGGAAPVPGVNYYGAEDRIINIHEAHANHVKSFLMTKDFSNMNPPLNIGYCPYHGAGRKAVPRMLKEAGLTHIQQIHANGLSDLDGLFPSFNSDPGKEQQPDPGDPRAATIAVNAFKQEYPGEFEKLDLLIGTDPDADRYSGVVKVPENQRFLYGGNDWMLLPSDDMWALLIWYRLMREQEQQGRIADVEKKFIVLSHTTTDALIRLCQKFGIGAIKTWVGFAALSAAVRDQWDGVPRQQLVEGRIITNIRSDYSVANAKDADSLDLVELIMRIEEEFGIDIPDNVNVTEVSFAHELVEVLLRNAIHEHASEIRMVSQSDSLAISYLVNGQYHNVVTAPKKLPFLIIERLKSLAGMTSSDMNEGYLSIGLPDKTFIARVQILKSDKDFSITLSEDKGLCHPYICEYYGIDDRRNFNIATVEQSAGFSLLGGAPPDQFSLGVGGHVRDKDGTFAAILSAEVAAWAKQQGTTLFELVDKHIYLDPAIGLFVNFYEPDPLDGEYPGIEGDRKKIAILNKALELFRTAQSGKGNVVIGGQKVLSAVMYRTGKYDRIYPPDEKTGFVFPDEGVRFYFSEDKLNSLTVRPSGTGNSLRFHVQMHAVVNEENLITKKADLHAVTQRVANDIRSQLGAPRE